MQSKYQKLPFLPETNLKQFETGLSILQPLSRRGYGPGLIVLVHNTGVLNGSSLRIDNGIPSPVMKWGEEGYSVVEITEEAFQNADDPLALAIAELADTKTTEPKDVIGLVAYSPQLWNHVASKLGSFPQIVAACVYGDATDNGSKLTKTSVPVVQHLAGKISGVPQRTKEITAYEYPGKKTAFATPFQGDWDYPSEAVSHSRNLTFLKKRMDGPYFDLEAIWDEHTYYEFENRSVECTMDTMVQEPYVNHITTLTGGVGRAALTKFYRNHFIFQNPQDVVQELISRSVGIDRVIDEFIFKCTHNSQIDWLIPGIPPTGRYIEVSLTAVVNIRGDRLYHEHIQWDQTSVLIQLGLMPDYLPYPYPLSKGEGLGPSKKWEYRVPAKGIESAQKLRDNKALESNELIAYKTREALK